MRFPTASARQVARLHHYQRFVPAYLHSVLVEHRLHFSDPRTFNDPWDCKPFFRVDHLTDPKEQARLVNWYKDVTRKHGPPLPDAEIERRASHFLDHPDELVAKVMEMSLGMGERIGEAYRVYCLTPHADSELMWAHYAGAHSGVCLEFDATHPMISDAQAVHYSKSYPRFDVITSADPEEDVAPLFTKSAAWAYEEEYRLVAQERSHARNADTIITDGGACPVPEGVLTGVIIGCLADDTTRAAIRDMIAKGGRAIAVKEIVRAPDAYRLMVVP